MKCTFEHTWQWSEEQNRWICADCGAVAKSINPLIEPCLACGAEVDAAQVYCSDCMEE